jgi:tyrosine-protein kinase Etk/Wzc
MTQNISSSTQELGLGDLWSAIKEHKQWIWLSTVLSLVLATLYCVFSPSIYQADALIQIEAKKSGFAQLFGGASAPDLGIGGGLLDSKSGVSTEIGLLSSRLIMGEAIRDLKSDIDIRPAAWWSMPKTHIRVDYLDVPKEWIDENLSLEVLSDKRFVLYSPEKKKLFEGLSGQLLEANGIKLLLSLTNAQPKDHFFLKKKYFRKTHESLKENLRISEKGKGSGLLEITYQDTNPKRTVLFLRSLTHHYIQHNINRKTNESQKTLSFLEKQLPILKRDLEESEQRYNQYRAQHGTVEIAKETEFLLKQFVDMQTKTIELQQKREELLISFTEEHPSVRAMDSQIRSLKQHIDGINAKITRLPQTQQDSIRLMRDVQVNTSLYTNLLSNTQQLKIVQAGALSNVQVIDEAMLDSKPVAPKKLLILIFSLLLGLLLGSIAAIVHFIKKRAIYNPEDISKKLGLNVLSVIPSSPEARSLKSIPKLLSYVYPNALAIEGMRSLRTSIKFLMLQKKQNNLVPSASQDHLSKNKILLVSGTTPGIGKSFVSSNLAYLLSQSGSNVLLVDMDIRRGYLHERFGVRRELGVSEYLSGSLSDIQSVIKSIPQLNNFSLLTTGVIPDQPSELMMGERLASLFSTLSSLYDYIIVDSPPILVATDAVILAKYSAVTLLVARAGMTTLQELDLAYDRLKQVQVEPDGVVFNDLSTQGAGKHYAKHYQYHYHGQEDR